MEVPVENLFELGHGRVLGEFYVVVEVEQDSGCEVMWYNDFCFRIARCISGLVSLRD